MCFANRKAALCIATTRCTPTLLECGLDARWYEGAASTNWSNLISESDQ
ncbi:hypothetical protein GBAR_LOCUS14864, partial [Geodia barretti]